MLLYTKAYKSLSMKGVWKLNIVDQKIAINPIGARGLNFQNCFGTAQWGPQIFPAQPATFSKVLRPGPARIATKGWLG